MPVLRVVAGLFGLVGWFAFVGLQRAWRITFGWLFSTLADLIDVGIPIPRFSDPHPFGRVADWLRSLDHNVYAQLGYLALQSEHLAVWLFSRLRLMFSWLGREVEGLAGDVLAFAVRLVKVTIPRLVGRLLRALWREVKAQARAFRTLLTSLSRKLLRLGHALVRVALKDARDLLHFTRWTFGTIRRNWKAISGVAKMLRKLLDRFTPTQFSGLLAHALHSLGVPWLLATNVKRIGAWIMRLDIAAVWEFVEDAVTFLTTTDMCKLASYQMDLVVFVFDPVMQEVVALTEWFCVHSGDSLPSATTARPGYAGAWQPSATPELTPLYAQRRLAPDLPLPNGVIEA